MKKFKKPLLALGIFVLFLFLVLFQFATIPLENLYSSSVIYDFQPGASLHRLANDLQEQGILKYPKPFIILAKLRGVSRSLQAGEYRLERGMTINHLLTDLHEGHVVQYPVTLIEGETFSDVLEKLKENRYFSSLDEKELSLLLTKKLDIPYSSVEGLFFPDTYYFTKEMSAEDVLTLPYKKMQSILAKEWKLRADNLPYQSSYEALIAASLIEKETGLAEERALVAEVLINRLNKGMRLQFDPSVIYALGDRYKGKLSHKDLKFPSFYNTYLNRGLPPTPIAMPGRASLHAALHPGRGDYLYFVARGDGGHFFSKNLAEHQKAVLNSNFKSKSAAL